MSVPRWLLIFVYLYTGILWGAVYHQRGTECGVVGLYQRTLLVIVIWPISGALVVLGAPGNRSCTIET